MIQGSMKQVSPLPELDRAQTSVSAAITISPIHHISGDAGGLLGEFFLKFLGMFYPTRSCARANVAVTELITNVMEHAAARDGELRLVLTANPQELVIDVSSNATVAEFEVVQRRLEELAAAKDPMQQFAATVHARHRERQEGGLGLMRLVAESKFRLTAQYAHGLLSIRAHLNHGDLV